MVLGFGVHGLGLGVHGFRVWGLGFRVRGQGMVWDAFCNIGTMRGLGAFPLLVSHCNVDRCACHCGLTT